MFAADLGGLVQAGGGEQFDEGLDGFALEVGYAVGFVFDDQAGYELGILGGYAGGAGVVVAF